MKKLFIFPALFFSLLAAAQPRRTQDLKYQLQVKLNDKLKALDAKMVLRYTNHSADTLSFIWLHIWPNAYRNDRTGYTDQLLENGKTGFYFSGKESKGYINRMEFRVNGTLISTEDHPEYMDVIKLILPAALNPGDSVTISSSFHVKLPENFSGFGYNGNHFQITNWYPEAAVYDRNSWHPMPFFEQGGAYHEPADYIVEISVPPTYRVTAGTHPTEITVNNQDSLKTYHFFVQHINSFAWVADKGLVEKRDSVLLDTRRLIRLSAYYFPKDSIRIHYQLLLAKTIIPRLSAMIGEYPYNEINLTEASQSPDQSFSGLIMLNSRNSRRDPERSLREALVAQWFQSACLSDERKYPWMSKGFVQYYILRLKSEEETQSGKNKPISLEDDSLWLMVAEKERTTQPINTSAEKLSRENYRLIAGTQSAVWLRSLEDSVGRLTFDQGIHTYFENWKYNHPDPADLKISLEKAAVDRSLENRFADTDTTLQLLLPPVKRPVKPAFLFSVAHSDQYNYINFAPAFGYNRYNDFMIGAMIHNYNLPENNFEFLLIPLYSYSAKSLEGLGRLSYTWYPDKTFSKITIGLNGERFASNYSKDSAGKPLYEHFSKLVPYLRFSFRKRSARSTLEKWMDFKSYLINEKEFTDYIVGSDSLIHPGALSGHFRYLNQVSFNLRNDRVLYPYRARLELQQSSLFYRINIDGHYFFNYPSGGGLEMRLFASKFGTWNNNNKQDLSRYEPKLLGVTGEEDYTYDQYFIGRSASDAIENSSFENNGLPARQISMRDGGLKLRIDAYDYLSGRSANWVSALNFSTTLPAKLFPIPLPIRIFFDVGTYAEAWKTNTSTSRFLYTGGIQLSLLKNVVNIYAPLINSSDFKDALRGQTFWERLTFSLDIQNINYKKWLKRHITYD